MVCDRVNDVDEVPGLVLFTIEIVMEHILNVRNALRLSTAAQS